MPATKPDSETGWSKEFPSLRYGSWFWLREGPDAEPRLTQLCGGYNFYEPMGIVGPNTEYLGPISPSDFEQLLQLRAEVSFALANAHQWVLSDWQNWLANHLIPLTREALAHTGGES